MSKYSQASKILADLLKENQRRNSKTLKGVNEKSVASRPTSISQKQKISDLSIEYCSYCSKAFSDSRCLLKHILRRHADDLLRMHRQYVKGNYRQIKSTESDLKMKLSPNVGNEIADLKKMLNDFKVEMFEQLNFVTSNFSGDGACVKASEEAKQKTQKQESKHEAFEQIYSEFYELKQQCQYFETHIQNLEEKYKASLESIRHKIATTEERRQQSDNEIRDMIQNTFKTQEKEMSQLKEEIGKQLTALRQVLFHEIQKQYSDLNDKMRNLEIKYSIDVQALQKFVEQNFAKLDGLRNNCNIEEMFEKQLQNYLSKISKKSKRRHTSTRKSSTVTDSYQVGNSGKASIFTFPHMFPEINYGSNIPQSTSKLVQHDNEILPKINVSQNLNKLSSRKKQSKPLFITKRIKFALQKDPNILDGMFQEITRQLENKLHVYGVSPGQTKLSVSEFETMKRLINEEPISQNRNDFINLRNRIDELVTKKVKLYLMKNKCSKGVTFVKPKSVTELSEVENVKFQKLSAGYGDVCSSDQGLSNIEDDDDGGGNLSVSFDLQSSGDIIKQNTLSDNVFSQTLTVATEELPPMNFDNQNNYPTIHKPSSLPNVSTDIHFITVKSCPVQESGIIKIDKKSSKEDINEQCNLIRQELNFNNDNQSNVEDFGLKSPSSKLEVFNTDNENSRYSSDSKSSLESISNWDTDD